METLLTKLRQVLKYEVSIETLIEVALWLAIPYLLIGLTWAFFHVELVQQLQDQLAKILPAGASDHPLGGHGIAGWAASSAASSTTEWAAVATRRPDSSRGRNTMP